MSTERDPYEPTRADLGSANAQPLNRSQDFDRTQELDPRELSDRPVSDREVAQPRANAQPADTAVNAEAANERAALFEPALLSEFNTRWTDVQASFVDEPRRAVEQADRLVSDVIQRIADSFSNERTQLEQQWDRGGDVSTEDLRQALRRYRSFFSRLLSL
jgi:hypothetical protein